MDHPVKGKIDGKPRILVAPLDWGLGHATRCIPLIRELIFQGADPILAGEAAQEHLLRTEFPQLSFINLPGYRIKYAKTAPGLTWKMILQASKIKRAIQFEQQWLQQKVKDLNLQGVISDNRYGLFHKSIPCIFITHQLRIKSPWGRWTENILQKRNYKYIERFQSCWVPDFSNEPSLAGELSHPDKLPVIPVEYTGPLSRIDPSKKTETSNDLLVILSGPEPQRSLLENKIINEIAGYPGNATVIRGLPGHSTIIPSSNMIQFTNHLPAKELSDLLARSSFVISRGGYSTIMDLIPMRKKCIFIPTPGQTEQIYLCNQLQKRSLALTIQQKEFSLTSALKKAKEFHYNFDSIQQPAPNLLKDLIKKFLASV